jgi:hypothetical protein
MDFLWAGMYFEDVGVSPQHRDESNRMDTDGILLIPTDECEAHLIASQDLVYMLMIINETNTSLSTQVSLQCNRCRMRS